MIIGGLKHIAETNERIVPFMALFCVLGALIIVIMNIGQLFPALGAIFRGAFNLKAAAGGVGGSIIALAIDLSDTFNGLMAIPNLIGVVVLCGLVRQITKNYTDRRLKGQTGLKPMLSAFPEIQAEQEKRWRNRKNNPSA